MDDVRVADDLDYQTATSLSTEIAAGTHDVHIVGAAAPDNSVPLVTIPVEFAEDGSYTLIANGSSTNVAYRVLSGARSESMVESNVEFRLIHGAADLGVVDVRPFGACGEYADGRALGEQPGVQRCEGIQECGCGCIQCGGDDVESGSSDRRVRVGSG